MEAMVVRTVQVNDIVRLNERRYRFTVTARVLGGGRLVIRDCLLLGPMEDGTFTVFGPSHTNDRTGYQRQLVLLPPELRAEVLRLAVANRQSEHSARGGTA